MLIRVYENKGVMSECLGIIDEYISLNFTKSFKETGTFSLKGNYSKDVLELLKPDRIIAITPQLCGVIHSVDMQCINGEERYIAYGFELKGILSWRIVWDTYSATEDAVSHINNLVFRNARYGDRKLVDNIITPAFKSKKIEKQVSYKNLQEVIQDILKSNDSENNLPLGYDVYLSQEQNQIIFEVREGKDRSIKSEEPLILSRDFENVIDLLYIVSNKDSVNAILCAGEGEGEARKKVEVFNGKPQGFSRKEYFVDAKEIRSQYKENDKDVVLSPQQYEALLRGKAWEEMTPDVHNITAHTAYIDDALGLLGSKITVIDKKLNLMADDFISEVNIIDEADGMETTLSIGEDVKVRRLV